LLFPSLFIGAVWAATFRGGYVALGLGGFPGLYEGALAWTAYLVLFALALRSHFALDRWIFGAAIIQAAAVVGQDRGVDVMDLIGHVPGAIDHSGTLYSPNYVGSFFALMVPFALASAVDKRSKAALLVCAVSSYALYLSHSTAGAAGAAAGCAVFAASWLRVRDSFVFGAIILAALSMGNGKIQDGIVEIWRSFPAIPDTAISARAFIWRESIPLLPDVAVLGYGPGKFPLHFPQSHAAIMYGQVYGPQVIVDKVHSLYLQIIFAAGGLGMLAFVGTLGGVIGRNRDMRFVVACVGYLVAGFANDSVVSVAPIFWIMLGRASQKRILDN
jgi:O-antigen ligase